MQDTSNVALSPTTTQEDESRGSTILRLNSRLVGFAAAIAVAVSLFLVTRTQRVESRAVISVLGLAIVLWMCSVFETYLVGLFLLALLLMVGVPPDIVFAGFAASPFWLLLAALYFGFVMKKTGLARRIGLLTLRLFNPSYATILFGFFLTGTILSLAIPSFTVRIAIMVPLAWSIVGGARLQARSIGSALIVISAFEMAVLPGYATLTGSINGLLFSALFQRMGIAISWLEYSRAAAVPAFICSLAVLGGNLMLFRPAQQIGDCPFVSAELATLGRLTREEKWTLVIISSSLGLWATQSLHHINEACIALLALIALFATGVMLAGDFEIGIPWRLLIFSGVIMSLVKVIPSYGIDKITSSILLSRLQPYLTNMIIVLLLVPLTMFLIRFFDTTGFLAAMMVFIALYEHLNKVGFPPVLLAVATLFSTMPFWFLYQNFWFAMADGLTDQKAFTPSQQAKMATIYAGAIVLSLVISIGYWYAVGLISKIGL